MGAARSPAAYAHTLSTVHAVCNCNMLQPAVTAVLCAAEVHRTAAGGSRWCCRRPPAATRAVFPDLVAAV